MNENELMEWIEETKEKMGNEKYNNSLSEINKAISELLKKIKNH